MLRIVAGIVLGFASAVAAHGQIASDPVTVPVSFQGLFNAGASGASVSITPNGTNTATWQGNAGTDQLTTLGLARLRPGKTYTFTISCQYVSELSVKLTAPSGYRIFINNEEKEMFFWSTGNGSYLTPPGYFSFRIDDGRGAGIAAATTPRPGRVLWSVGLGDLRNGKAAGSLVLAEDGLTANAFKPAALYFDRDSGGTNGAYSGSDQEVIVVKSNNVLRQVYANAALVDIVAETDHSYYLRFYPRNTGQIGTQDASGVYAVTGTPIYEFKMENPTYPALDALRITKTTNQGGQLVTWTEMRKQGAQPAGQTQWVVQDWTDKPAGASTVTSLVQQRWTYTDSDRTELIETLEANGTTVKKILRRYEDVNFFAETSRELSTETVGDVNQVITTFTYYLYPESAGSWRRIKTVSSNTGAWTAYDYFDDFRTRGQVRQIRRPHKDAPLSDPGTDAASGEVTTYWYDFQDTYGTKKLPTKVETKIDGVVTGRSEISYAYEFITDASNDYSPAANADMPLTVATRKDYFDNTQSIVTVTKTYREDADPQYRFFPGLIHSIQRPDKTMTAHAYYPAGFVGQSYTPLHSGEGRAHLTIEGTWDTTVGTPYSLSIAQPLGANFRVVSGKSGIRATFYGGLGNIIIKEQQAYVGAQWVTVQQDWANYVDSFYLSGISRRAAASGGVWPTITNTWVQGRLDSSANEAGVTQRFTYDSSGRVKTVTRDAATAAGVTVPAQTTTNTYDAASHVLGQSVVGVGSGETLTIQRTYDLADRVLSETPAGLGQSTFSYNPASRTTTVTLPTTATRTETRFRDGRLASVSGTALVPEYYDYLIGSDGRRHTAAFASTFNNVRRNDSWIDWLGRTAHVWRPGFTGQGNYDEVFTYDPTTGQLQKIARTAQADTIYVYNSMGELVRSGLDVSSGGLLPASTDRIVDTDLSIEQFSSDYWATTKTWTYPFGNGTTVLASTVRQRLTGLSATLREETRSYDADNNETRVTTQVDSANKLITLTTSQPGMAASQVDQFVNALQVKTTGYDGVAIVQGYDPLARPVSQIDPRTGTSTVSYWPNTVLVKDAFDASGRRLSTTQYDSAGRPSVTLDAFNKTRRLSYNGRNQIDFEWGSAVQPSAYTYDEYGIRTKMRTYQDPAGAINWDSATWPAGSTAYSETEWEYDAPSGLLKKKYDPSRAFVEYTYNNRGQTYQRFWARTYNAQRVTTTYGYDGSTTELNSITYNDTTPAVSLTYTRTGQIYSATDGISGPHDFIYDPSAPWRLASEALGSFYNSRVISRTYDGATSTNTGDTSYTGHTLASVNGAANGYQVGTAGTPAADLQATYAISNTGRMAGLVSKRGNGATSRQFVYGYEANSALLKSVSVVGNAFFLDRSYESNRDLVTRIEAKWGTTTRTKFDYTYDDRQQRSTMVQTGDAFADYGDAIHQIYTYNMRGELTAAGTFLGASATAQTNPLSARRFEFDFDAAGNRKFANSSGNAALRDDYTPNSLNQYSSRENNTLAVSGTANPSAVVAAGPAPSAVAGRAGASWGDNVIVDNAARPFSGGVKAYAAIPGGGTAGADLVGVASKIGFLAQAAQSFSYDSDGNLRTDGVWVYDWDGENRLFRMTPSAAAVQGGLPNRVLEFRYDYRGRRVVKRVIDGTNSAVISERRYLYNGDNLIAELDGSAVLKKSYTWGLDLAGSASATGGVGALLQIYDVDLNKTMFPTYDGNGNVVALLSDTGSLEAAYEYSPFGELLRSDGAYAQANPFRFSTKFTDDESGLVYYGARYYSPSLGRFINRDPIGESGGLNLYGFCGNDSVNCVDYLGYVTPAPIVTSGTIVPLPPVIVTAPPLPPFNPGSLLPPNVGPGSTVQPWQLKPSGRLGNSADRTYASMALGGDGQRFVDDQVRPLEEPQFDMPEDSPIVLEKYDVIGKKLPDFRRATAEFLGGFAKGGIKGLIGGLVIGAAAEIAAPVVIPIALGVGAGLLLAETVDWIRNGCHFNLTAENAGELAGSLIAGGPASRLGGLTTKLFRRAAGRATALLRRAAGEAAESGTAIFCFPAGTLVLMADGSTKPIEEVQEGDEVLADDPLDGDKPSARRVTHLHANWTERLLHVTIDKDGDGVSDGEIQATGEHPIWTQNRGWVHARDLAASDQLLDEKGNQPAVLSVSSETVVTSTFNLSVQDTHTFFVLAGSTPVLVHNTNPGDRLYIVYQAPTANGTLYTGRASMGGAFGSITPQDVLEYRFGGGHHRGIDFSQAKIREAIWGGGRGSGAYDAIRGAEELYYQRAVEAGVAADQIAPIRAANPNAAQYLEAAREIGATPCP